MAKTRKKIDQTTADAFLGAPVLIRGEDETTFKRHVDYIKNSVPAYDIIDEMYVRDVVRSMWDLLRYRRLTNALLNATAYKGLVEILKPLVHLPECVEWLAEHRHGNAYLDHAGEIAEAWVCNETTAHALVNRLLQRTGLSIHEVMAEAMALKLPELNNLNVLAANAEMTRNYALRELERRNFALAVAGRRFADEKIAGVKQSKVSSRTNGESPSHQQEEAA